jgi:ABC-type Mn2+/Zn2+ transport system ATPase subunit
MNQPIPPAATVATPDGHTCHDTAAHICWGGGAACGHTHRLEVAGLTGSYRETVAFEDITFATECGRSLALLGPNGAGKSSLIKTLAGIHRADRGSILWRGKPLKQSSREIAYLPQREDVDWNFPLTVRGLIEMGRYPNLGWWRRYSEHDAAMVTRAIDTMQLADLQHRQIRELSGGQQQRAFIARALAQEAHVLLLDEPFAGLDRAAQHTLETLLRDLIAEGRLLICSHHDLSTVPRLFDDVLLIRRRTIAFGPVATAFTPEAIEAAYV